MLPLSVLACTPLLPVTDHGPAGLLGRHLSVDRDDAWAECRSPDDSDEDLLVEAVGEDLDLFGLEPDTLYRCRVTAGAAVGSVSFRTDPLPDGFADLTVSGETDGYTLLNTQYGVHSNDDHHTFVIVVDPEGRVRWLFDLGPSLICDIDAQYLPPPLGRTTEGAGGFHIGGGWANFSQTAPNRGVFLDLDLAGTIGLQRSVPDFGEGFNHESERLADGTTLSLTAPFNHLDGIGWVGAGVEQWSPTDGVVWSWTSQQLVQEGVFGVPTTRAPYTANAVALVDDPWGPGAWVSAYSRKELWRIDRDTGERTHVIPDDFTVWDPDGNQLPSSEFPYDQHDPEWSDGPYGPDTRVLLYDNGNYRPGGSYSRVAEYDVDLDRRELILLWSWTEPDWYDPTLGDADRLPDGRVLIAKGFNLAKTPTSADVSAVVELDPPVAGRPGGAGSVRWRLSWGDGDWTLYRAQRIDGCAVFANARYCSAVAGRLQELRGD